MKPPYSLFQVTGIELEYMVVDRTTLQVRPIVDRLFERVTGAITSDVERGEVEWSNELVAHVVELKTARPTPDIPRFRGLFHSEVKAINRELAVLDAMLLPTAAHPFMDPFTETVIWPHEHNEVYALYNRIFDCRGHGWSNLQSMHLNLPFQDDAEFGRLHAALRVLLPLIPAISASSPLLDGRPTGWLDGRMQAYLHHQERLPQLMGRLIPERAYTRADYTRVVFEPILAALKPFDTEGVMDRHFANSRGAIARFDRGAIEVRVIDLQECPMMDLAVAEVLVAVAKALVEGRLGDPEAFKDLPEEELLAVFTEVIRTGRATPIAHPGLLAAMGLEGASTAGAMWEHLAARVEQDLSQDARKGISLILEHGSLAERILACTGNTPDRDRIVAVYRELADHLEADTFFA